MQELLKVCFSNKLINLGLHKEHLQNKEVLKYIHDNTDKFHEGFHISGEQPQVYCEMYDKVYSDIFGSDSDTNTT